MRSGRGKDASASWQTLVKELEETGCSLAVYLDEVVGAPRARRLWAAAGVECLRECSVVFGTRAWSLIRRAEDWDAAAETATQSEQELAVFLGLCAMVCQLATETAKAMSVGEGISSSQDRFSLVHEICSIGGMLSSPAWPTDVFAKAGVWDGTENMELDADDQEVEALKLHLRAWCCRERSARTGGRDGTARARLRAGRLIRISGLDYEERDGRGLWGLALSENGSRGVRVHLARTHEQLERMAARLGIEVLADAKAQGGQRVGVHEWVEALRDEVELCGLQLPTGRRIAKALASDGATDWSEGVFEISCAEQETDPVAFRSSVLSAAGAVVRSLGVKLRGGAEAVAPWVGLRRQRSKVEKAITKLMSANTTAEGLALLAWLQTAESWISRSTSTEDALQEISLAAKELLGSRGVPPTTWHGQRLSNLWAQLDGLDVAQRTLCELGCACTLQGNVPLSFEPNGQPGGGIGREEADGADGGSTVAAVWFARVRVALGQQARAMNVHGGTVAVARAVDAAGDEKGVRAAAVPWTDDCGVWPFGMMRDVEAALAMMRGSAEDADVETVREESDGGGTSTWLVVVRAQEAAGLRRAIARWERAAAPEEVRLSGVADSNVWRVVTVKPWERWARHNRYVALRSGLGWDTVAQSLVL